MKPAGNEILASLVHFKKETSELNKKVQKQRPKKEVLNDLVNLRGRLNDLRGQKPLRGDPELFRQYCEALLGILLSLERSVQHSLRPDTQDSLIQIEKYAAELFAEFGPRGWERFKFWLGTD